MVNIYFFKYIKYKNKYLELQRNSTDEFLKPKNKYLELQRNSTEEFLKPKNKYLELQSNSTEEFLKPKNKYLELQRNSTEEFLKSKDLIGGGNIPKKYIWVDNTIFGITFSKKCYDYKLNIIPKNANNWIKNQINFFNKSSKNIKNIIILLTEYSMKSFNIIEDKKSNKNNNITKNLELFKIFPENRLLNFNKQIKNYAFNSPILDTNITVYSGKDNLDFLKFSNKKYIISKRFWATTFNKEHANLYSFFRNIKHKIKNKIIVFNISIPKNTNNIFYYQQENQIIILPNTKFEIYKKPLIKKEYIKDIADINTPTKNDFKIISNWFLKLIH